ncbi:hypothetical protein M0Q97_03800 [Candidatus Dojkabacteria bacterium]|jgi:hypothetical protein|nr:hypothetical protein [Candidatus Dojkabacteria bacterium]
MIIILTIYGFIIVFEKKSGINKYFGFSLIILGFIFFLLSATDLIPKQTVITFQKIVPMENDLEPSEKIYFYDDDKTVTYYTLNQKEMKFPSNIVKYDNCDSCDTSDCFAHIISVEYTPTWTFILGFQKSITTEVTIITKNEI